MGVLGDMIDQRMDMYVKLEKDIKNVNTQWMKHSSINCGSKHWNTNIEDRHDN